MRNADDMGMPPADFAAKMAASTKAKQVRIWYTNHRGEHAERVIYPREMWFGTTVWHPAPDQWFVVAHDEEKNATRYFAMKDISGWMPA